MKKLYTNYIIKKSVIAFLSGLWILGLAGCDDEVSYQLQRPEPGQQKILVEEVSGVRCPNCPEGTRLLNSIKTEFDSSLIIVTYHGGIFSYPYDESKYDFKTDQTLALLDYLGSPEGYPAAVVQRRKEAGKSGLQRFSNTWYGLISQLIGQVPTVTLNLNAESVENKTKVVYQVLPNEDLNGPIYGHLYLIEDGLIDYQADSRAKDGLVADYVHDHVLKYIATPIEGLFLGNDLDALSPVRDSISIDWTTMNTVVDRSNVSFVFFVTDNEKVLQVEKAKNNP